MSWIPVDRAARSLTEILFYRGKPACFLHLENPVRQPASDIFTIMGNELGVLSNGLLPFDEWLQKVKEAKVAGSLEGFFGEHFRDLALGTVILDTQKARAISPTLRGSGAVSKDLIVEYARRWKEQGLFA
jgi:hypothetical protein